MTLTSWEPMLPGEPDGCCTDMTTLANAQARPTPTARPTLTRRSACQSTCRVTAPAVAPSAIRTPISFVRCTTRYDRTPKIPDIVSASAIEPSTTTIQNTSNVNTTRRATMGEP